MPMRAAAVFALLVSVSRASPLQHMRSNHLAVSDVLELTDDNFDNEVAWGGATFVMFHVRATRPLHACDSDTASVSKSCCGSPPRSDPIPLRRLGAATVEHSSPCG